MSDIIQSLWIGDSLSKLEQVCIKSFIDNGHKFHLYTYGPVKNIPEGVTVKDGNEILHESEIFRYKNGSVSAFSNLFRFTMLYKKGGYWVDTDVICVKPFRYTTDFVISSEPNNFYTDKIINAGVLKFKKGSIEALEGINIQRKNKEQILSGNIQWGSGPSCVKQIVNKFNLHEYVLPWTAICTCLWSDFNSLINPYGNFNSKIIKSPEQFPTEMVGIHLWNELFRRNNINKNDTFHPDSLIEHFKKKHNI